MDFFMHFNQKNVNYIFKNFRLPCNKKVIAKAAKLSNLETFRQIFMKYM